ncbi:hypothetical protein AGDE_06125 [Angomonas deanei]|nr:hypothetical protein AGDE_06125 [Angomonas deanei]|eukprot:EPY37809.1 hypothetical protein AGDE_06125 [Angomonas deanei]
MNATMRGKKLATAATTNEFHKVRLHEYNRESAAQGSSENQGDISYFVPTLQSLCIQLLADNFDRTPAIDELREDAPELYERIMEKLPTGDDKIPLQTAVSRISSEQYWKRCCEARWSEGQLNKFVGTEGSVRDKTFGWKRLYLEHLLADFLLTLSPTPTAPEGAKSDWMQKIPCFAASNSASATKYTGPASFITESDQRKLAELCGIGRDYIHTIELPLQVVHLNLYPNLFSRIPGLLNFSLTYTSVNGMSSGLQDEDAASLSEVLTKYNALQVLRLPNNRIQFEHLYRLVQAAVVTNTLQVLDLSRNALDDRSVQALAYLLIQPQVSLVELNLNDNSCGREGAKSLVDALQSNKTLRVLRLQQNRLSDFPSDSGYPTLVAAAASHASLVELHLSYNALGLTTLQSLPAALSVSGALRAVTLTGNPLVPEESKGQVAALEDHLYKSLVANTYIQQFDCEYCNLSDATVRAVNTLMQDRARARCSAEIGVEEASRRAQVERDVANKINYRYAQ